jgi:hypothetical protein
LGQSPQHFQLSAASRKLSSSCWYYGYPSFTLLTVKTALFVMWGFWLVIIAIQILRGASWIDLLVVMAVFTILLALMMVLVPKWVAITVILAAHIGWFGMAMINRKRKPSTNPPINSTGLK